MLRSACGYALANAGHEPRAIASWMGHRSIQHTVRYTELSPTRFKDFSGVVKSVVLARDAVSLAPTHFQTWPLTGHFAEAA